jgi:hypothetical protein
MPEAIADCKPYLNYLDQEMTIMGILSTFCIAVISLVLDRLWGADKESFFRTLWESQEHSIIIGSALLVVAASFFYIQRSHLAYFCGGISMTIACPPKGEDEWQLVNWLKEVDSWHTWRYYRIGFTALILGSVVYAHLLYRTIYPTRPPLDWLVGLVFSGFVVRIIISAVVLSTYRYETKPYKAFAVGTFFHDWRHRGEQ